MPGPTTFKTPKETAKAVLALAEHLGVVRSAQANQWPRHDVRGIIQRSLVVLFQFQVENMLTRLLDGLGVASTDVVYWGSRLRVFPFR